MNRKQIIILLGSVLAILWLELVYIVMTMPKYSEGSVAVSPTPNYANPVKPYPPEPVVKSGNTIRVTTRPAQRPTHVTLPPETPSSAINSPFTYLGSDAAMKSVGSGIVLGSGQGSEGTSSPGARGIVYTSSSHSWVGFVSPVAAQEIAYVPAGSGSLPDNGFMGRIRLAPPDESGGGTNGPNIETEEQPVGEGLWLLLYAAITYMIIIFYTKKKHKSIRNFKHQRNMKNLKQICVTILLACACTLPAWASKNYCDEVINNGGVNYHLTFEKTGTNAYRAIVSVEGNHKLYKYPYSSPQGYVSHTGEGTSTVTITYNSTPDNQGFSALCLDGTSSAVNFYFRIHENNDINWNNVCTPPDTQNPIITDVAAQNTEQTSITVRVTATDNQTNDTGVASITVTRRDNSQSQTQNISPAVIGEVYRDFVFNSLSAGTTYTFDVTVTDAAGRTASTSQNLATQAAVVDNTAPSITSAAAENIKATTADIRVVASDNIGVTRVVILNGETTIKDQAVGATASLNQAFTLTGLTKNTTYNNIKVIVYDARPNGSNIYNVSSFTTKNTNTIYFVKSGASASWGATKIHYIGGWEETVWPGVDMSNTGMTNCDNTQIWRAEIPDNTTTVVFDNGYSGGDNQSSNQTPLANQYFNYERNAWYSPENLYILGAGDKFGNWTRSDAFKFSTWNGSAPTSVTKTLRLTGNSYYQFKIQYFDSSTEWWRGNSGTMESNSCTKWLMNQENNCQIHTGSTGNYTFTYDFTANKLSVTYPVPDVGCEGTSTMCSSGGTNFVHYTLKYIGGNMVFSVRSTTANALQTCKLNYAKDTNGQDAVNNVVMTVTNGEATYTLPATGVYASGTMYFYFTYQTPGMGSEGSSASGFSSNAFQYNIGGCPLDDGIPFMLSASESSKTATSVTLDVSGVVNIEGAQQSTTQYVVSTNGGSTWSSPLTASEGKITISDLEPNTEYTFVVKTKYGDVVSENSKSVTVKTNRASDCGPVTWYQDNTTNYPIEFELRYVDDEGLTIVATSLTENDKLDYFHAESSHWAGAKVAAIDASGEATITIPNAQLSAKGTIGGIFFVYSLQSLGGNVQTASNFNIIYPAVICYVMGECEYSAETNPPCMNSASVDEIHPNSVTINVSATDAESTVTKFYTNETGDRAFTISDGKITIDGLASCTNYTFNIYCKDNSRNSSKDNATPACQTKQVSFTTQAPLTTDNLALGRECGGTLTENTGERPPRAFDGDKTATYSYTSYTANGNATTLWVNLGSLQEVNKVRIYWGDNFSNNYKIECSTDGSDYTTVLTFTSDPVHSNNCSNYQEHTFDAIEAQYIRIQTVSTNWVRIYEFEVYGTGECPITQEQPMMISGAATDEREEEAVIHLTSRDNETSAANMIYHLNVRSTSRDLTNWNLTLTGEASGDYTIKGLVPGTNYTVTVYCEDGDGYLSTADVNTPEHKQRTFSFTTSNGGGNNCTKTWEWEDIADIHDPSFNEWPADKYHFLLEVVPVNDGGTYKINFRFTVTKVNPAEELTMSNTYLHIWRGGWLQEQMGSYGDWTFNVNYDESDTNWEWNADNRVGIKCELSTGACIVGPFIINPAQMIDDFKNGTGDCGAGTFVITQKGRTPEITLPDGYNGSFAEQILYYRQFSPGQWEPFTVPFEVASVEVYDPDVNAMFTLTPVTTSDPNGYYLLRQQVANVSGADFKESWYNGTDNVPQKKTAYNIFFPMNHGWGEFYTNKYVLFRGTDGAQTVETSFSRGADPTADDQYTLYGNNTLSTTTLTAYFETDDGKFYEKEENRTLQPFECYVLANATTLSRMPRIAPWKGVPTDIENTWAETTFLPNAAVYNTFGQLIFTMQNTVFYDVMERCMTFPAGCYIVISELGTQKIIIP